MIIPGVAARRKGVSAVLSAVKNFFLTFILALAVFGLIATAAVRLVVDNINGTLERSGEETGQADTGTSETGNKGTSQSQDERSLNILLIGTDYRPDLFSDYDPEKLELLYGIKPEKITQKPVPGDVVPYYIGAVSSDTYYSTGELVEVDGQFVIPNGFYSVGYRQIEADAIVLLRLDLSRRQITLTPLPGDAYVEAAGSFMKLSEIYGTYGPGVLCDAVHIITGINPTHYVSVDVGSFPRLVDALDGIEYYVPENMQYTDKSAGIEIDLKKGMQTLDGQGALSLMMYRNYKDHSLSREQTCLSVLKAVLSKAMSSEYFPEIGRLAGILLDCVRTDISGRFIIENVGYLRAFAGNVAEILPVTEAGTFRGSAVTKYNVEKTRLRFAGLN